MFTLLNTIVAFITIGLGIFILFVDFLLVIKSRADERLRMLVGYLVGIIIALLVILIHAYSEASQQSPADMRNIGSVLSVVLISVVVACALMFLFRIILGTKMTPLFLVLTIIPAIVTPYFMIVSPQIGSILTVAFMSFLVGVGLYLIVDPVPLQKIRSLLAGDSRS
ncbi:MAG: hypothetical protein EYC68_22195 [Chloroflexota bacterium]|nr:MAG: hypothetical protein EYC68_22195 [Chloroflexota bacterium]